MDDNTLESRTFVARLTILYQDGSIPKPAGVIILTTAPALAL